ncbi:LacI family DNA-binding transcriptional regulator [Mycolicibacterium smegmatis]|uniref:LacI family DNA-binding transcriptional regulator n=1 Tax=Mycolicibacterium smegmatis TaxID=1772 RepID=UPI0005D8E6AD|nr:LacI family DNA-binding transcriptional regulator [Mycolicibacterium smegmatis]MDF1903234.1 LacI family DNA-binding transcriptional regulator [Mycolicibacterium smegmatis]MDF1909837.1 LacI family DNA-binding transcriptional regulator [Mycolicibacterium smegmatis]MDF1921749.1 LacI family DNA-binding transcriptional regulator [Mycolicibacterium smegmatis]MDF1928145.1 LacI family DNA-binding transcriptional regulator [Mycolicibacterium smegmatis]UGT75346.1 LacI family DNA-binding transcription
MVTMRDVAKAAGVSQAAVSYAYSGSPRVSAQVRDRILTIAHDLGYTGPNIAGSSLRSGRIGTVGVLVAGSLALAVEDPSTMLLLKGIVEVGELADVALTLLPVDASGLSDGTHPIKPAALRGLVDGVVLHCLPNDHPAVAAVVARRTPAVAIDSPRLPHMPYVTIDHRSGGIKQMKHVLSLGHRRIGVITDRIGTVSPPGLHDCFDASAATEAYLHDRLTGYVEACHRANVAADDLMVIEAAGIDMSSGVEAAGQLLDVGPTAIVATSDVHAVAAIKEATRRGLQVPGDVSVIGFDDAPLAELVGLTTIHQPLVDKGRTAAAMLLDVIAGKPRRRSVKKTELKVRGTTGPPPD